MGSLAGMMYPPYRIEQANGILGNLDQRAVREIVSSLRETGFYIFHKKLPTEICDELMRFALTTPARPLQPKYVVPSTANGDDNGQILYDRQNPVAVWYYFDQQRIYENPVIQSLATDLSVLAVAQAYLSCQPIQDSVSMWWSTSMLNGTPDPVAAQLYHIDMDRLRFINFFIYLTDVNSETGPHCYVPKSNRNKPRALCRDGRISDQEIAEHYGEGAQVELTGSKGTILVVDTTGFHKGKPPQTRDRLIMQLLFTTSMFGQNYEKARINDKFSTSFLDQVARFKRTFSNLEPA
jgi:hypothetical protein